MVGLGSARLTVRCGYLKCLSNLNDATVPLRCFMRAHQNKSEDMYR